VTLSGRLGLLPRKGVQITIQARNHGRWDVVGATRTLEGGRFRWHHVFSASQRGRRFTLRARAASPIYPFAAGTSKPVGLRLR